MKGKRVKSVSEELNKAERPHYVYYDCPRCASQMRIASDDVTSNSIVECGCGYRFRAGDELS